MGKSKFIKGLIKRILPTTKKDYENYINNNYKTIHDGLVEVKIMIAKRGYYYNNDFERKLMPVFYEYFKRDDFKDKYFGLISNLDSESIKVVNGIISRQKLIKNTLGKELDIFTQEEQKKLIDIEKSFSLFQTKIAEGVFCYEKYMLPVAHFEASVFVEKHGIERLKNLEKIKGCDIIDVGAFIGDSALIFQNIRIRKSSASNLCMRILIC
jgi:hypothetical protein